MRFALLGGCNSLSRGVKCYGQCAGKKRPASRLMKGHRDTRAWTSSWEGCSTSGSGSAGTPWITKWLGLEGTLKIIHPTTGRDPFHQPRVLRAPSNLALSTARERATTASLGNLGQGLTTLIIQNFFLISYLNLPSFSLKPSLRVLSPHALVTAPLQLSRSPSRHWQLL